MSYYPYVVAAVLFVAGLYGVATSRHYVHLAVCLTVMQSSTYVLLLSIGYVRHGSAPVFKGFPQGAHPVDPVVQALTLTDVVVSIVMLALVLALTLQAHKRGANMDPDKTSGVHG